MVTINKKNARVWSMLGARGTYGAAIFELAKERSDFMAISADLGNSSGLRRFQTTYPNQFINTGIAEQNMIGVAAGLAKEGTLVYASSFAPFIAFRGGEQVRMNMGYMKFGIKAVGIGSGLAMGHMGNSHYGLEDIAIMRAIPNITIISPADGAEIVKTVFEVSKIDEPVYIRLTGAANNPIVYTDDYSFEIGKGIRLKEGQDICIIASGTMVYESLNAASILEKKGISTEVINMHTIKPLDEKIIDEALKKCNLIVSVEEHSIIGGLGSAIAEYKSDKENTPPLYRMGCPDIYEKTGDYQYMLDKFQLKGNQIAENIIRRLGV